MKKRLYRNLYICCILLFFSCGERVEPFDSLRYWEVASLEQVKKSIANGESLTKRDVRKSTALMRAVLNTSDTMIMAYLVEKGAKINDFRDQSRKESVLMLALNKKVKVNTVRFLLNRGANVNQPTTNGLSPLMVCSRNLKCSLDVVDLLIQYGAKINARDRFGRNTFYYAVSSNPSIELIRFLKAKGANYKIIERYKGWNVFFTAVLNNRSQEYLQELVRMGIPYQKVQDIQGENLIICAIASGRSVEYIRDLVKMGISPHIKTKNKETSLMFAVNVANPKVIAQLIRWKVDLKVKDIRNKTALDYASKEFKQTKFYQRLAERILK